MQVADAPNVGGFVELASAQGNVSVPVAATPDAMELSVELPEGVFELRLALTKCNPPEPAAQVSLCLCWSIELVPQSMSQRCPARELQLARASSPGEASAGAQQPCRLAS